MGEDTDNTGIEENSMLNGDQCYEKKKRTEAVKKMRDELLLHIRNP